MISPLSLPQYILAGALSLEGAQLHRPEYLLFLRQKTTVEILESRVQNRPRPNRAPDRNLMRDPKKEAKKN